MKKIFYAISILLLIIICLNSFAQNELRGVIRDKNTTPLEHVSIYLPDLKTGTATKSDGSFAIKNIPPGNWLVEVSLISYRRHAESIFIKGVTTFNYALTPTSYELNEVVVTGVSSATIKRENPMPISVLNKEQLLENSSSNIVDAISVIPGVSQITVGPSISKPVIRGLGYNRIVTINDGVRQEGQQWFDEFGIEIDENSVHKVEVLKGPASLSYGSDALAGVINFLGPVVLPEGQIKGNLLANYQTNNGLINGAFDITGNKKGFNWYILYSHLQSHDYKNKYDGYVWNSAYGENNLKGIFGINKHWGFSTITLSMFNLKLGVVEGLRDSATGKFTSHNLAADNSDSLGIAPPSTFESYNKYPITHQHIQHYKAVSDNSFVLGKGRLSMRLGLQFNYRQEANDITKGDIYNNYFYLRTFNYGVQHIMALKNKWELSYGVNGMQQSSEDRGIVFVLPEYDLFDLGVFGIAKKSYDKLSVTGGLRFDDRTLHGKSLFVDDAGNRLPKGNNTSIERFSDYRSDFSGFSGSLGFAYDFSKSVYGKLNISRGFRAPTAAESGQNGIHDGTPFYEIGDHNLKAENSMQLDATLGINSNDVNFEINGFVNRINNYIFPVKLASVFGGDSIRSDNVAGFSGPTFKYISGDAVLSGGEVMLDIHPRNLNWFDLENSFSTVRAIQLNQGDSTKYLPYTPPSKFQSKFKLSCRTEKGTIQNGYVSVGAEHYFKQDKIYYQFGNETVTPGYTLVNAGFGGEVHAKNTFLFHVYFTANNLFDVAYQSNMSRLKYTDTNNVTGRTGVFNMGRNFSLKVLVLIDFGGKKN